MGSDPMIKKPHQPNSQPHHKSRSRAGSNRDAALRAAERDTRSLVGPTPTATTSPADVTPAPSVAATPVETVSSSETAAPQPASHPAPAQPVKSRPSQAAKPAKSACHKLFCAICVLLGLILLSAGGIAIWYFGFHHQPEKAVLDAFNQLGEAENLVLEGGGAVLNSGESNQTIASFNFISAPDTPGLLSTDLTLFPPAPQDDTAASSAAPLDLQLNAVVGEDGVPYLQISGLADLFASLPADLSPEALAYLEPYRALFETVDNEWWQFSLDDFVTSLELDPTATQAYHEFYGCLWDLYQTDYRALFAALYRQHPFLQIQTSEEVTSTSDSFILAEPGSTTYVATIDFGELAAFLNQIPTTDAAESYFACYNNISGIEEALDATDFDEVSADELRDALPGDLQIELVISNWSHQLQAFQVTLRQESEFVFSLGANLSYQAATVTLPTSYRPLADLVDELSEFLYSFAYVTQSLDPSSQTTSDVVITEETYAPTY